MRQPADNAWYFERMARAWKVRDLVEMRRLCDPLLDRRPELAQPIACTTCGAMFIRDKKNGRTTCSRECFSAACKRGAFAANAAKLANRRNGKNGRR